MPYQPTGKPAGRPRKDGLPPGTRPASKPAPEAPEPKPAPVAPRPPVVQGHPANAGIGVPKPGPFPLCRTCWPDGWPKGWTATSCPHGTWARPWTGRE